MRHLRYYWRLRLANGPLWRGCGVLRGASLEALNILCAETGGRSYRAAVNVPASTPRAAQ